MALLSKRDRDPAPLRQEMERFFEDLGRSRWTTWPSWMKEEDELTPAIEVGETDDEFFVKAQVPGMSRDDLGVEVTEGAITIKGEVKEEKEEKKKSYYRREFSYGHFARTIPVPPGTDANHASAHLKDGVLSVRLPKTAESKKRTVQLSID